MDEIACPDCGEQDDLAGRRDGDVIALACGACGTEWSRDPRPRCPSCDTTELIAVPLAIVEKGRGTQLSVVGTRTVHLCPQCDAETLARYERNRPNPLMPDELPTMPSE